MSSAVSSGSLFARPSKTGSPWVEMERLSSYTTSTALAAPASGNRIDATQ
jgi:hypothetical protein